jgi:hypothetical protein
MFRIAPLCAERRCLLGKPRDDLEMARVKLIAWKILTGLTLGILYVKVIAEGCRFLVPGLGRELMLGLDGAIILSFFLMLAVWKLWELAICSFLGIESAFRIRGWNTEGHERFVVILSIVLLFSDAALFYLSVARLSWKGTVLSFTALIATCIWLGVIVFVSFVSVHLRRPLLEQPPES